MKRDGNMEHPRNIDGNSSIRDSAVSFTEEAMIVGQSDHVPDSGMPSLGELLEQKERYEAILDGMVDAVITINEKGLIEEFNSAAERLFGYGAAEVLRKNIKLLMPPPFQDEHDGYLARYLRTGKKNIIGIGREVAGLRKNGTTFPLFLSVSEVVLPSNSRQGASRLFSGIVRDLTREKQAQETVRQSEERLAFALEATSEGLWDWDITTGHVFFSPTWIASLGYEPNDVQPHVSFWKSIVHPDDMPKVEAALNAHLEGRTAHYECENRLRAKSGEYRWNLDRGKVVKRDDDGTPLRMIGTDVDITADKRRRNELKQAKEAAEAANRAKSEFLANMSHEIRTPMTAILGFNDIILENTNEPEIKDAAQTVKENGEYLISLINDILDLSKIEAGMLDVERVRCSPHEILAEVASLMKVRATGKGLPLEVALEGLLPEVIESDPTRLRQILINIVGNAIKFTETGSIKIVARLLNETGEVPKLQFDVIDTGIGIVESQIKKIFRPFSQSDSSTTRRFGGSGLGLAISKRLVELLGGTISISSTIGLGSTFSVTVQTGPLDGVRLIASRPKSATDAAGKKDHASEELPLKNCRILLAEDGPDNQRLIRFILKKAGGDVTVADNGQIALDQATAAREKDSPFDVILMDMQMPVLDGYAATRQLRDTGHKVPIIALTAHAMASDRQKCLDAGCDEYLTKPIDRKKLVEMVHDFANAPDTEQEAVLVD